MDDIKSCSKLSPRFTCKCCDYSTSKTSSFDKHLLAARHKRMTMNAKSCSKVAKDFICECGNVYKYRQGLSKHRKTCNFEKEQNKAITVDASNNSISNEMLLEFFKKDTEFKAMLVEAFKNGVGNTTNSHNTTNKNKFNINLFLNEQCKDAMNIMDFVNTMQLQLSDLERVGELGYVKGISHIVVNKLKDLDVCKRPIHCSDLKRETMYVKDENVWGKEGDKKDKLSKMIKHVAHKNQKQIGSWQDENPEYKDSDSMKCDEYLKIVGESMNGLTNDDDSECYTNKIIKNIAKEVTIKEE